MNIFSKKKKKITKSLQEDNANNTSHQEKKEKESGIFSFFKNSLNSAKKIFSEKLINIFSKKILDKNIFQDLENLLLSSDFGVSATQKILHNFKKEVKKKNILESKKAIIFFKQQLLHMLAVSEKKLSYTNANMPMIILIVGVNGVGKTTAIIKLAHYYNSLRKSVMLSAGDTFRAAASEQLIELGLRNNIPVFSGPAGIDAASIVFDSVKESINLKKNILIIDTAGRLHNKGHLIQELQKINRVIKKCYSTAPHEIFLVLDATIGQNSIQQAKIFSSKIDITGIILTKLDGTAKGGVIFSITNNLMIPIRYLSYGEKVTDFKIFNSKNFVDNFLKI